MIKHSFINTKKPKQLYHLNWINNHGHCEYDLSYSVNKINPLLAGRANHYRGALRYLPPYRYCVVHIISLPLNQKLNWKKELNHLALHIVHLSKRPHSNKKAADMTTRSSFLGVRGFSKPAIDVHAHIHIFIIIMTTKEHPKGKFKILLKVQYYIW